MELDDFKNTWAQYDSKLTKTLQLNEQLLKKMNLDYSKRELQKPLQYELTGIAGMFFLNFFTFSLSMRFIGEPEISISGFVASGIGLIYLLFAIIKASRFLNIDYYGTSVVKLQKDTAMLNRLVLQLRKYELILIPFYVAFSLPLIFKLFRHINIFTDVTLLSFTLIIILGIGFPMTFWINKHVYDKRFQNSERLLKEIENYESDT